MLELAFLSLIGYHVHRMWDESLDDDVIDSEYTLHILSIDGRVTGVML